MLGARTFAVRSCRIEGVAECETIVTLSSARCKVELRAQTKPLTEVRRHTSEVFEEVRATKLPVVVTEHGKSAGVILDPEMFDLLAERLHVLEEIALGEMDIAAGNHVDWEQVKAGLQKWKR